MDTIKANKSMEANKSNKMDVESLTIRVKDQLAQETFFKIKTTTKMEKVFKAFANMKGGLRSTFRFLLDGERINPEDTPKSLELEDQDQIDCVIEQIGGC